MTPGWSSTESLLGSCLASFGIQLSVGKKRFPAGERLIQPHDRRLGLLPHGRKDGWVWRPLVGIRVIRSTGKEIMYFCLPIFPMPLRQITFSVILLIFESSQMTSNDLKLLILPSKKRFRYQIRNFKTSLVPFHWTKYTNILKLNLHTSITL